MSGSNTLSPFRECRVCFSKLIFNLVKLSYTYMTLSAKAEDVVCESNDYLNHINVTTFNWILVGKHIWNSSSSSKYLLIFLDP